jgi:serine/threonine-protein kinase SRPK3
MAEDTEQSRELLNLQSLQEKYPSQHLVQLLDSFIHQGPNGSHQCLVFELLGPTVDFVVTRYREDGESLEPETILRLTKQLLQSIAYLHKAGYAHGGQSNIILFT